jgi:spore coat protein U-like protein
MQIRATMSRSLFAGLMMLATATAHGAISCSVNTLPLNFGNYNPLTATALDVATTATITCTTTRLTGSEFAVFTSSINKGGAPSFSPRQMRNALNNPLDYNLFTTTARTTIFGDGSAGTSTRFGFGSASRFNPAVITHDIFGRIFASQDVSVGTYSDTLIFTVTF